LGIEFIAFKYVKLFDMLFLVAKKVIVMHIMGVKNLYDVLPKILALITQVQPQGVKQIKGCQWDNTNHTYLLRDCFWGNIFTKDLKKIF
jgi:hypothetical protein